VEYKGLLICDVQFYERRKGVNFICEKGVKSVDNLQPVKDVSGKLFEEKFAVDKKPVTCLCMAFLPCHDPFVCRMCIYQKWRIQ